MKHYLFAIAALSVSMTSFVPLTADAQQANPFARPQARAAAAVPQAPMDPNMGYNQSGMPGGPGHYGPGGPSMPPGYPGMVDPAAGLPNPTAPVPVANGPTEVVEEVQGSRIGVVNGKHIYRGSDTYHFEPKSKHKVTRKLASSNSGAGTMTPEELMAMQSPAGTSNLPSAVGRPRQ